MSELSPLYLLDTNILVHLVRGDAVWARIRATYQPLLIEPCPIISVITVGELRSLALQFNWKAEKIDQMEFYLGYLQRVSIDDTEIIRAYAVIDAHCHRGLLASGRRADDIRVGFTLILWLQEGANDHSSTS